MPSDDFVYDLPHLLWLREEERRLSLATEPRLCFLASLPTALRSVAVLAGSFNPLTRGHTALVEAARREGSDAVVLLLPLRAIDKEGITRAAAIDRALVLLEWARRRSGVGVALVNRGLYVEQAALLREHLPSSEVVFVVGHDKIVQVFDPRYYDEREQALEELFRLAAFRVAPRLGQSAAELRALLSAPENAPYASGVVPLALDTDVDALSSTLVREAIRRGEPWEDHVPAETAHFVRAAQPYSPPTRLSDGTEIDAYGLRLALIEAIAAGRLDMPTPPSAAEFATLCQTARADTPEGARLRTRLAEHRAPQ
jgi:nicotinic acid mononucleotide adenylyltransferase